MDQKKQAALYRLLFFVFCAANFIFLNAFILYFDDPGRVVPAPGFITVMIVFAGLETVLAAGTFFCLLMVIRLQREGCEEKEAGEDDLLALPPRTPRVPKKEEIPGPLLPFTKSPPHNFERILRMLIMLVIVVGVIFIGFLVAVSFVYG